MFFSSLVSADFTHIQYSFMVNRQLYDWSHTIEATKHSTANEYILWDILYFAQKDYCWTLFPGAAFTNMDQL